MGSVYLGTSQPREPWVSYLQNRFINSYFTGIYLHFNRIQDLSQRNEFLMEKLQVSGTNKDF